MMDEELDEELNRSPDEMLDEERDEELVVSREIIDWALDGGSAVDEMDVC
jgi:hypothetical protein